MIKGIRAHDVKRKGLEEIAKRCKELDMSCIQLVLAKSIDGFSYGNFSENYALKIKSELDGMKVAVLGGYINPSTVNKIALKEQIDFFKEQIRYAKVLEAGMVGTETGFYGDCLSESMNNTEEAYNYLLKNMRELLCEAEKYKVNIGIEGVYCFVINTPEKMYKLVKDLNSEYIKVIFDPVNYLNEKNYMNQEEIINRSFELLNDKIAVIHAKDFKIENGKMLSVLPGEGLLDYRLIFDNMKKYFLDVPIILEAIGDKEADKAFYNIEKFR